jgi:hypothetical protein
MQPAKWLNLGCVMFLCIGVHMLLIAANVSQNMAAQILRDQGFGELGFYAVGLMNGTLGFACLFIAPVTKKLGDKCSLSLGTTTFLIYIGCQLLAVTQKTDEFGEKSDMYTLVYILILFTAFLNGVGQAIFWMTAAAYIKKCSSNLNKGAYNGFLLTFDLGSHITGNLMAGLVIPASSTTLLYAIFSGICFLMIFFWMFTPEPAPVPGQKKEPESEGDEGFGAMWKLLGTKKMLTFIPLCSLSAISLAVYQAVLIPVMIMGMSDELTDDEKVSMALVACVGLGVGEVIGGFSFSYVQDAFQTKVATYMCLF